ncbi:MAG: HlyD family efflux transporter periplasmic adaptor subunit [Propionicimonas sp.]|uniref:HlyD family efflux transporter periplasmic adaptor subunit n=1 Tax=Propionicimonas sp. TaxID=1955623 RepID=UPI003D117BFA
MTWENRLRLTLGVLGVIVVVGLLTVVFNQRQNQIASFTGAVGADVYTVGADYSGTVVKQDVDAGDSVTKGEELFVVQSLQLKENVANGLKVGNTEAYRVDLKKGTITYFAVVDGTVQSLNARLGNSLGAGSALATIASNDRYVLASFRLFPRDYARVHTNSVARIRLADDELITGIVTQVSSTTGDDGTVSQLRIESGALPKVAEGLRNPGAPVGVTVTLADSGPLAGVGDALTDFLVKIGLR